MSNNSDEDLTSTSPDRSRLWKALGVAAGVIGVVGILVGPFLSPGLRKYAAPYIPCNEPLLEKIVQTIQRLPRLQDRVVCDLGSGDGTIVLHTAKRIPQLSRCWGVELNAWLVWYARLLALQRRLPVKFVRGDIWKQDYSAVDALVIVGVPDMMQPLEEIIGPSLPADGVVISGRFPLHSWKSAPDMLPPDIIEGQGGAVDGIWIYRVMDNIPPSSTRIVSSE